MQSSVEVDELGNPRRAPQQIDLAGDSKNMENGLARLVLTVVEVIRQVLEKQAIRRVEAGTLTEAEVERLGMALMQINAKLGEMSREFGIRPQELRTELGALLRTGNGELDTASLVDVIDRLLNKGVVVAGQVRIAVADIDLVGLDLFAKLYPIYGVRKPSKRTRR
jgi:gas vesicle protein GvpK/gas vesicle protein GvpA/GvpJ/GvpM family